MILWKLRLWLRRLRFAYDLVKTKLSESEAEAEEPNAHCDWFILPLLLPTPSVWFTIDLKRNVSSGVVSGVGRNGNVLILLSLIPSHLWPDFWFSLGHKRSYDTVPLTTPTPTPTSSLVKTSLYDLKKKKKHRSHKQRYKRDGLGVRWIRAFPFHPTPLTFPSLMFRLCCSENQIVGVESRSGGINKSQCTFPRFLIGLVLLLLLLTASIWFSLDH